MQKSISHQLRKSCLAACVVYDVACGLLTVLCAHVYNMHVWYISLLQCGVLWGVLCGVYCLKQSSTCHLKIIPQSTLPEQSIFIMLEQLWKLKGILPKMPGDSVYLICMLLFFCDGQHTVHETVHMNTHKTSWYTQEILEHTQET